MPTVLCNGSLDGACAGFGGPVDDGMIAASCPDDVREQVLAVVLTTAIIANRHLISTARVSGDVHMSDATIFAELAAACRWSKWLNLHIVAGICTGDAADSLLLRAQYR